ncbi:MAG: S9 family peptidase [Firmicutes bacterium]|nr:S9 family peptidase [Bacillota bacterium]
MKKVAIDDMARIKALGNLTLSPSGNMIAFTVKSGDMDKNGYKTDIWIYDETHEPALYRLTAGGDGGAPIFMGDDAIVFEADRRGKHKADAFGPKSTFCKISLGGGEAEELFFLPFKASSIKYLGGDKWLAAGIHSLTRPSAEGLAEDEKAKLAKELEEERDYEVFDELPFWANGSGIVNKLRTGLYLCDAKEGTQKLLSEKEFQMMGFTVSPDRKHASFYGSSYEGVNWNRSRLFTIDLETLDISETMLPDKFTISDARYIGDKVLVLGSCGERMGSSQNDGVYLAGTDGSFCLLCEPDMSFGPVGSDIAGGGSSFEAQDAFYFIQNEGYRSFYKRMDLSDASVELISDDLEIISAAVGYAEDLYLIGMEKDRPQELYRRKDGKLEKLSYFNEEYVREHELASTEHFVFKDREGTEIDGFILRPFDLDESKKYPAILSVHGGPRSAYGQGFFHEFQYWTGKGYIVFFCNPPGSSGKGDAFADILGEKFGVRDFNAIMDFTDEVLRRVPQIDPARVAMTGGSYGGFMANWIIGHTDRFAAVVSCRSISNYTSKLLTTDIGYYHNASQMGCYPWTDSDMLWRHSPLAYADKVKTPTLFIQSDEDYRCWMGDAIQMLQALLLHGVPARMCLFHGENHELSRSGKPKHRVRRIREMTEWFDRWTAK